MSKKRIGGKEPYARLYASVLNHGLHVAAGLEGTGLWTMALAYSADQLSDGFVPAGWLHRFPRKPLKACLDAGLLEKVAGGYLVHDFLDHNPSKAAVNEKQEWWNQKKALHRDRDLIAAIRGRDEDQCRYCGVPVNWKDKRGPVGGTYDHVIPRGPNSLENVVVACRDCNGQKSDRTPEESQMPLLPIPTPIQLPAKSGASSGQNGTSPESNSPHAHGPLSYSVEQQRAQT